MTPAANQLETVLRYAYLHGLSSEQWLEPTKECLQMGDASTELCALLLNSIFSFTRVSDSLLESYVTIATTGKPNLNTESSSVSLPVIEPITFIHQLVPFVELTASQHPYQWSYLLKLLPELVYSVDTDTITTDLQKGQENPWVQVLTHVLEILSHIVAVGLYPEWYSKSTTSPSLAASSPTLAAGLSFNNHEMGFDSQFSFQSQHSINYDADATLDIDNTQRIEDDDVPVNPISQSNAQDTIMKSTTSLQKSIEIENAATAAHIMIYLIEQKSVKRIFEVCNNQKRQAGTSSDEEPWVQCQAKLYPKNPTIKENISPVASQNPDIQRLLQLIQRLTDRELERRMAVHMKYHELEDEGTARAMPSAGLMGLLYHLVQIRPSLDDERIIDYLTKLQKIKGSFDESFYLELWLTALTGLREASLNTSCQTPNMNEKQETSCNAVVATNRLLWKSLVLVKLPCLIEKMQKKKQDNQTSEFNAIESSLRELKAFTGLINACSPPACCSDFYAPDSVYTSDLNTASMMKSIRAISNNDIFTNIVQVCERYGFVRPHKEDSMMDIEDEMEKSSPIDLIDQNIDARIEVLRNNVSFSALTELIHIGLVSPIHLSRILDFLLELLKKCSLQNNFFSLAKICEALTECPCSIDLMLQLYNPYDLLGPLESICNHWTPTTDVDMDVEENDSELDGIQLLYSKFGKIWNLWTSAAKRFKLYRNMQVFEEKDGFLYDYFTQGRLIYGRDVDDDEQMESLINHWMAALASNNGLSDDLLRSTRPQHLVVIVPTIIHRSILLYAANKLSQDTLINMVLCFFKPFLHFTISTVIYALCDELLNSPHSSIILTCLSRIILSMDIPRDTSLHPVLGTLESLNEFNRQAATLEPEAVKNMTELEQFISTKKMVKITADIETVTTGVTPNTLFEKASLMFKYIVKSGRSMYMSDVDADTHSLWDTQSRMQVVSHYLDMVLFETALEIGGGHWFVSMIVDQVLEAGKCGGAVRAAELGSCLITTPLLYSNNRYNSCIHLLRCLLQDVLPSMLQESPEQNMSYFQGQTLGVFTSNCLVLMQDQHESINQLGKWFFDALVIDLDDNQNKKKIKVQDDIEDIKFAEWNDAVTKSAVWRGFIKGLMSNPIIEEVWPNAFL
ncbi:mediator complex subunit [Rhizopus stolonifer]|uniref:Mediator of RNA polymerase II transcription subunit 5 n=1 Tax=Rhizopus stolonifer TaxID=4846 RepID=A0A367KRT9_RHIST|nr:mediator complex subunit [Rhizopus stolonifer]